MGRRPLKTFTRTISHFINLCDNRYRCLDLTDSWTTTSVRSTCNISACLVVPPSLAVTDKANHLLTLSRVCSWRSLTFVVGNSREIRAGGKHASNVGRTLPVVPVAIPSRGHRWAAQILPLRTPVDSGSYHKVKPGGITLDGTLEMVRQRHQRSELKRYNLVSPR